LDIKQVSELIKGTQRNLRNFFIKLYLLLLQGIRIYRLKSLKRFDNVVTN